MEALICTIFGLGLRQAPHTAQAGLEPLLLPLRHCDYRHVLSSTVLGTLSDAPIFEKSAAPHKSP